MLLQRFLRNLPGQRRHLEWDGGTNLYKGPRNPLMIGYVKIIDGRTGTEILLFIKNTRSLKVPKAVFLQMGSRTIV